VEWNLQPLGSLTANAQASFFDSWTSNSNIEILEHFQSKVLRLIVNVPWYVPNSVIGKNLRIPSLKEEISSSHYDVRISVHPNERIASLTEPPIHKRLRRYWPHDLLVRF
jgi:hypothetical protein